MNDEAGYRELVVRSGDKGKGRAFRAAILAMATAPVWDKHDGSHAIGGTARPVFLMLGCQAQEAGAVVANMRLGRDATMTGDGVTRKGASIETIKSARYAWGAQRVQLDEARSGVVVTACLLPVVGLDPGIVEPDEPVRFLIVPPRDRLDQELARLPADEMRRYGERVAHGAFDPPSEWDPAGVCRTDPEWHYAPAMAMWFCAMVDRRSTAPILPDPLFQMRVYLAALRLGLAGWAKPDTSYYRVSKWGRSGPCLAEWGYASVGLAPGVACAATQSAIRELLIEEVRAWNDERASRRTERRDARVRVVTATSVADGRLT